MLQKNITPKVLMLSKIITFCALIFLPWTVEAKIIETAHVADVIPLIDEETWFLVDLDNTMYEGREALGHLDWFYDELQRGLDKGMPLDEIYTEFNVKWEKVQKRNTVKPVEEDFVPFLQMLQNRNIVIMGLTHRNPNVAKSTIKLISSLGFDFKLTAPSEETFNMPEFKSPPLYKKGILFVNNVNKKGEVLLKFLDIIKKMPKKVIFIDDKRHNVEEVEQALKPYGIEYIGVHYTAILYVKPVYSRQIAEVQYKYINKLLSNEAAQLLIEHGLD